MSIEVLSNTVYINHGGIEMGIPLSVIKEILVHPKIQSMFDGGGEPKASIMNCPKCGLISAYSGACGYCGSKCE